MSKVGFGSGARETRGSSDGMMEFRRQKALLKTGALQDAIFNSANFSSIATDAKGVIQIFNVGAERMLGYTAAEVMNKITPADISDPQEVVARAEALSLELETKITPGFEALVFKASRGIEDIYELTYIRKDGSRFPAVVSVTALRDAQEGIIGYLLIGTDNTARKLAEEALLKAGALQSAIFNSANFSSIATDAKGVIQIFNVGAERMLGYTAAEVMNKITPADISDPQEVVARAEALSLELETKITPGFEALVFKASRGIEDIYELTYIRKDGSRFPAVVSVTALRDAQEGIIGYLLIGTDNTARKEVEMVQALLDQRLRDQQFYTRSLIESNIDALMTTDPQGIITDVNQQMIALTGCTRDELIGAPCRGFFTDPIRADAAIKRVLTENKVSNYELTVRAQNGEETVVSYNAATFYDRERKLQGVFAAARDITERKHSERILQEKNVELEHATRMKSEFLATMSHELRTPLNAIIGFSEALKDGLIGEMSNTQHEYIGDIFTSGQHLLSLINDILDLSKVEAGMMTLELEAVDLNSLLSNSLSIVKEKAAAQSVQLELDTSEDLGAPLLDMRKTKQLVYNLLSNAVKFSANGGRVTLSARRVSRSDVGKMAGAWAVHSYPLADNEYNEFLEICVSDSGIGISEENMAKLFQAFSQIDSSLARKFEGTGLGLAMVKILAELHGGTVAVASAEDEGARFAVWLPLRALPQASTTIPSNITQDADVITAATVESIERYALVIDNDAMAADLVRLLLEAEGFSVLRAASAEDALRLAPQQTLSLIMLDIHLPGINAREFMQRIRASNALAQVPMVALSGSNITDFNLALTYGASAVLQKPISRAQLRISLANLGLHPAQGHTRTVLVVDDDPKAIEVIAAFLPTPAYTIVRAYSGGEAIAIAQRLRPDLILLDLLMPDVSGFDVVAALQSDANTADIPIVVITAKEVTEQDYAMLNKNGKKGITIVAKAGFNRVDFINVVRRALLPSLLPLYTSTQTSLAPTQIDTDTAVIATTKTQDRVALVVENDDHAADIVRVLLEAEGFSVLRAPNAEAALIMASQQTLSLITLDIQLPGMDGWAFLQKIRKNDALSHVPVVIIAGLDYRRMALKHGASAVLQKPVTRAQLKAAVTDMVLKPEGRPYNVLVVDDDPKAVEVIAAFLPTPAYTVTRAYSGSEAIVLAQQLIPDLVLLDLMMPEVNGFDVVDALQHDVNTANIPILMMTAKEITMQDRALLNSGFDKPVHIMTKAAFDHSDFITEVTRALQPH